VISLKTQPTERAVRKFLYKMDGSIFSHFSYCSLLAVEKK
jgi:hypothetical protein